MSALAGRRAVVTGGGTGIGRAICLRLASNGADIAIVSNVTEQAEAVAAEVRAIGRDARAHTLDVTDVAALDALAQDLEANWGAVDILVTSAGVMGARKLLTETSVDEWRRTIDVNLNAGFYCIKAFLPGMLARDRGRIITISSVSGKLPAALNSDYAASKHGVIGLTKALALELGILRKNGVTANAICPGSVQTPMIDDIADHFARTSKASRADLEQAIAAKSLQRRLLDADEIAAMAAYLASDDARGITGQAINVCGGTELF